MNKEEVLEVLEEDVFNIRIDHKTYININNSGTLNQSKLDKEKRLVLHTAVDYAADDLVKTLQHYPEGDVSEVEFKSDFVILKRKDYNLVKLFLEAL